MRVFIRTLLFISAFSPTFFTLALIRLFDFGICIEVKSYFTIGLLGSLLSLMIIKLINKEGELLTINIKKVESYDFMLLIFYISYSLPLITRLVNSSFNYSIMSAIVAGLVIWFITYIPVHPILRMYNYKFYKIETYNGMIYTLVSINSIKDPSHVKLIKKISDNMYLEVNNRG